MHLKKLMARIDKQTTENCVQPHLTVKGLAVGIALALTALPSWGNGVVLWNQLGSDGEVTASPIGSSFGIHSDSQGGVQYVPGVFGNGFATTGGETGGGGYLTMSPEQFYAGDKTKGTVSMWLQKRIDRFVAFETPLIGIFGEQPYDLQGGEGSYASIAAMWSDGFTGSGGMFFYINDQLNTGHFCYALSWNDIPVGEWVHVAFSWDLNGIEGTADKMRLYFDGVLVDTNTDAITSLRSDSDSVKLLGHHAYSRFGEPTAYMDNIVVYDYAKSDFTDRFIENPLGQSLVGLKANVDMRFRVRDGGDELAVDAQALLGVNSNGINPSTEDVTVRLGSLVFTVPAGSFVQHPAGFYQFIGTVNGVKVKANLQLVEPHFPRGKLVFSLHVYGLNFGSIDSTGSLLLTVGDDGGLVPLERGQASFQSNP